MFHEFQIFIKYWSFVHSNWSKEQPNTFCNFWCRFWMSAWWKVLVSEEKSPADADPRHLCWRKSCIAAQCSGKAIEDSPREQGLGCMLRGCAHSSPDEAASRGWCLVCWVWRYHEHIRWGRGFDAGAKSYGSNIQVVSSTEVQWYWGWLASVQAETRPCCPSRLTAWNVLDWAQAWMSFFALHQLRTTTVCD